MAGMSNGGQWSTWQVPHTATSALDATDRATGARRTAPWAAWRRAGEGPLEVRTLKLAHATGIRSTALVGVEAHRSMRRP